MCSEDSSYARRLTFTISENILRNKYLSSFPTQHSRDIPTMQSRRSDSVLWQCPILHNQSAQAGGSERYIYFFSFQSPSRFIILAVDFFPTARFPRGESPADKVNIKERLGELWRTLENIEKVCSWYFSGKKKYKSPCLESKGPVPTVKGEGVQIYGDTVACSTSCML